MRKEFLPFSRPNITEADIAAVGEVVRSGWITTGSKNAEFEEKFCKYTGCAGAVALSSATAGMHLALNALKIGPGDEVITPSMTWVSTLVADEDPMGAVCWFYKRDDVYLLEGGGEVSYGLSFEDAKHRSLNLKQFKDLVVQNAEKGRLVLIAKSRKYMRWKQNLPEPLYEDSNGKGGYVFAQY